MTAAKYSRKAALKVTIPFATAPNGICRWCGKKITNRRPRWCSQACVDEYRNLAFPNQMRRVVFERADYRCEVCKGDFGHAGRKTTHHPTGRHPNHDIDGRVVLQVDHRLPLVEGGKHELSNLRALCRPCHRSETRKLSERRALARRACGPTE